MEKFSICLFFNFIDFWTYAEEQVKNFDIFHIATQIYVLRVPLFIGHASFHRRFTWNNLNYLF